MRGFRIAMSVRDPSASCFTAGLSVSMGLQVFVIVGGVTS